MMPVIIKYTWIALQVIIGYNLVYPIALYLLYLVSKKENVGNSFITGLEADYAIIVTAYESTGTLKAVTDSLLQLNYTNYKIYIVADKCDVSKLLFNDKRVVVLRPPETLGSNTRSHFYAISHFQRPHERLTIIDCDNLAEPEYLNELNKGFEAGYSAVQGLRKAKNLDTTYACLDAARDMYYHFYDGVVLFGAGSSATLAGSGMAFTTALYKECLGHMDITGAGFDKVLQNEILKRGYRIAYTEQAEVYDEKTSQAEQLVKQRARWINTWFRYFKYGFSLCAKGIARFSRNQFLFGLTLLRPPLFIFLLLSVFFMMADIWISPTAVLVWLLGFVLFIAGFIIALVHGKPDKRVVRSLVNIPKFIFLQVLSLLKVRKANKVSVATQHYHEHTIKEVKK